MKRVFYSDDGLNNNKYVLKQEYNGVGIYQYMCPSGFYTHQSWALRSLAEEDADAYPIIIPSYMQMCKEEVLDAIDNYNEIGEFGFKVFVKEGSTGNEFVVHRNGDHKI